MREISHSDVILHNLLGLNLDFVLFVDWHESLLRVRGVGDLVAESVGWVPPVGAHLGTVDEAALLCKSVEYLNAIYKWFNFYHKAYTIL